METPFGIEFFDRRQREILYSRVRVYWGNPNSYNGQQVYFPGDLQRTVGVLNDAFLHDARLSGCRLNLVALMNPHTFNPSALITNGSNRPELETVINNNNDVSLFPYHFTSLAEITGQEMVVMPPSTADEEVKKIIFTEGLKLDFRKLPEGYAISLPQAINPLLVPFIEFYGNAVVVVETQPKFLNRFQQFSAVRNQDLIRRRLISISIYERVVTERHFHMINQFIFRS